MIDFFDIVIPVQEHHQFGWTENQYIKKQLLNIGLNYFIRIVVGDELDISSGIDCNMFCNYQNHLLGLL